ncbi:MAG: ankyrin repeat domain-containing protein [Actinomycetota bacterium]|nr:ankyrin repeat domain-containing protein [Actinomycetota bacterium]
MGIDGVRRAIRAADGPGVSAAVRAEPGLIAAADRAGASLLFEAASAVTGDCALPPVDAGATALDVVDRLLAAGADPSQPGRDGWTALHVAGFSGHTALAQRLVAAGAPADATVDGVDGSTPLSFALFYGHPATATAIASASDGRLRPAPDDLRSAAGLGDLDGIDRWLGPDGALRSGGDAGMAFRAPIDAFPPRDRPVDARTTIDEALTWAARNDRVAAMDLLVARGADVDANPFRGTPLLWATYSDRVGAARWLLDHGADPNLRHDFGGSGHGRAATALHLAAQHGATGCVELLLVHGADPTIRDGAHHATPADWAAEGGQRAVAERLRLITG